jgi:hypothetical protein
MWLPDNIMDLTILSGSTFLLIWISILLFFIGWILSSYIVKQKMQSQQKEKDYLVKILDERSIELEMTKALLKNEM